MRVSFTASEAASRALRDIGRTEDLRFSPGGNRLALPDFHANRILILDIAIGGGDPPAVSVSAPLDIGSPALAHPHGIGWLGETALAVANRAGHVAILPIPAEPKTGRVEVEAIRTFGGPEPEAMAQTPGSLWVRDLGHDLFELWVCSTYSNYVSRHLVDARDAYAVIASDLPFADGLEIPDGVTLSPGGRWCAVSNHDRHQVWLYPADRAADDAPAAVLDGVAYPHGVRFLDARTVLVADAGAPLLHVYRVGGADWAGSHQPAQSVQVLDDERFARGATAPGEGGPKGVDISADGRLVALTCREQPLAFFALNGLAAAARRPAPPAQDAEPMRAALLRHLAAARHGVDDRAKAIRINSEIEIRKVTQSRFWKATAPLRRLNLAVRGMVGGRR